MRENAHWLCKCVGEASNVSTDATCEPSESLRHLAIQVFTGVDSKPRLHCMQVEGRVREKADWLFKCVAEAYSVLTDSQARLELDSKLAQQERQERYSARGSPYKPPVYRWRTDDQ